MGVSKNKGTLKWMVWGYHYFRKQPYIFHTNWWRPHTHGIVICKTPPCSERILRPWLPRRIVKPWQRKRRRRRKPLGCQKPRNDREDGKRCTQLWVGKEMGRRLGCEFMKTPISQVIFWETFRIFECWSGFAIGQQKQGPRDYSRFQGGSKSYVATLLSVTWYLLVVGYSELVRTSIARFMRKQLTEVITNFKTSNL